MRILENFSQNKEENLIKFTLEKKKIPQFSCEGKKTWFASLVCVGYTQSCSPSQQGATLSGALSTPPKQKYRGTSFLPSYLWVRNI
jgi:hypothetical protein